MLICCSTAASWFRSSLRFCCKLPLIVRSPATASLDDGAAASSPGVLDPSPVGFGGMDPAADPSYVAEALAPPPVLASAFASSASIAADATCSSSSCCYLRFFASE